MPELVNIELQDAAVAAEKLRDKLFAASQNAMRGGNADLGLMERLFAIIQKVEILRRDIDGLKGSVGRSSHDAPSNRRISKEGYPKYSLRDGSVVRTGIGQNGLEYEHVLKRADFD